MPHRNKTEETEPKALASNNENGQQAALPDPLAGQRINYDTSGTPIEPLDKQFRCVRTQECGLKFEPWAGENRWSCPVCQFETFDQAAAENRAQVAGIKFPAPSTK